MRYRHFAIGALISSSLAFTPFTVAGQHMEMMEVDRMDLEVRAGTAMPGTNLVDLSDIGPAVGASIGWQFTDRVAFILDGQADFLRNQSLGAQLVSPSLDLFHYGGGFEVGLIDSSDHSPWMVSAILGGGATTMDTEPINDADDFTETYGHVNGGIEVALQASENVEVAVAGRAYVMFTDETETIALTSGDPTLDAFDTAVSYPLTLSLAWTPDFR